MVARIALATLALAAAMLTGPHTANAAPYWPWCLQSYNQDATHSCAFSSWDQCMATLRGIGGYCYANPNGPPPAITARSSRHAARH